MVNAASSERDVRQLDRVAHAAPAQVPVGEEAELERRDRALDRHLDRVDDEPAAVEARECVAQRRGALERVEVEDVRSFETLGLLGHQARAGGDDEHVVAEHAAVGQVDLIRGGLDAVDVGQPELDPVVQLRGARADDRLRVGQPERHEQQAGLIDVAVVAVDDDDLGVVAVGAPQPVGGERAAGAGAEDDDAGHASTVAAERARGIRARPHSVCGLSTILWLYSGEAMALVSPLPPELAELIAARLRTIGDPMRIRILDLLREGELSVGELSERLGTSQQNASKHLGVLAQAGIVGRRKVGTSALYRVTDASVYALCEQVCGGLQSQIAGLLALVDSAT